MKARSILLVMAAFLIAFTSACSSDGSDGDTGTTTTEQATTTKADGGTETTAATGDVPTDAAISKGIQTGLGLPAGRADCATKELKGAGLSAEALAAVAAADQSLVPSAETQAVKDALAAAVTACP